MMMPQRRFLCSFAGALGAVVCLPLRQALAQASSPLTDGQPAASPLINLVPFAAMALVAYLLLIRPANRQRKEQQEMLAALKRGDEVVTQSGIVGRIAALEESVVVLEVADKVKLRMLRDRITGPFGHTAQAVAARGDK